MGSTPKSKALSRGPKRGIGDNLLTRWNRGILRHDEERALASSPSIARAHAPRVERDDPVAAREAPGVLGNQRGVELPLPGECPGTTRSSSRVTAFDERPFRWWPASCCSGSSR